MGDVAQRVGRRLAYSEAAHFVDKGKRYEWNAGSGKIPQHGTDRITHLKGQRYFVCSAFIPDGRRQPLSDVREMRNSKIKLSRK